MFRKIMFWVMLSLMFVCLFQSCVTTKAYKLAMETGSGFEARQEYIKAFEHYQKALAEEKDDEAAKAKLEILSKKIAQGFTAKADGALKDGRFRDAGIAFDTALKYRPGYQQAVRGKQKLTQNLDGIKKEYARAEIAEKKDEWLEAVSILERIQIGYKDDPKLSSRIAASINRGYEYYRNQGLLTLEEYRYGDALSFFEKASKLRPEPQVEADINRSKKLIQADEYYQKALSFNARNVLNGTFDSLIEARKITSDHSNANRLYQALLPDWSAGLMAEGLRLMESQDNKNAYDIFNRLYTQNPEFPQAEYYYLQSREVLLKLKYWLMVDRLKQKDWPGVLERGNEIHRMAPEGFLYSTEMSANVPLMTFNMFFQRGLRYLKTGHHGKAILAFRSAEDQLGTTVMTQDGIRRAREKISETNRLNIAFWDLNYKNGEAGVSSYASEKIKESLASEVSVSPLKNIVLKYDIITDDEMSISSDLGNIDWGLVQSKSCNALLTGKIESLRIDSSKQSQWKTRVHKEKRIIDNKVYLTQVMKLARLKNATMNKLPKIVFEGQSIPRKNYKDEIKKIEAVLPGISPKVEADVEEKISYQVEKYTMTAAIRINVGILYQNGSLAWPAMVYQDEFQIQDLVIAPDLQSKIPEERAGDPLVLPSKYEFTQMALDHIIETKIIPDLKSKLENYGMRFYASGNRLYPLENGGYLSESRFQNAVEDYYKFLICYKDKGESDDKPEQVTRFLDRFISQTRLLGF